MFFLYSQTENIYIYIQSAEVKTEILILGVVGFNAGADNQEPDLDS